MAKIKSVHYKHIQILNGLIKQFAMMMKKKAMKYVSLFPMNHNSYL